MNCVCSVYKVRAYALGWVRGGICLDKKPCLNFLFVMASARGRIVAILARVERGEREDGKMKGETEGAGNRQIKE